MTIAHPVHLISTVKHSGITRGSLTPGGTTRGPLSLGGTTRDLLSPTRRYLNSRSISKPHELIVQYFSSLKV